jgi:leucyl aminopeptidase (aminopeptidase T)
VVLDQLGLSADDAFLVVSNPELTTIATELAKAAHARTPNVRTHEFAATSRDGEEPPESVTAAMTGAAVIAIVTRFSLSHTHARAAATHAGARIASMPGISPEIFTRAIPIEYDQLAKAGRALTRLLNDADVCRITSPAGTEIELVLTGRSAISDDGDLHAPAAWGNLPAGEAFIAPLECAAHGTIVFDGSLAGWGILDDPLTIELRQGRAVDAGGGAAADWLLNSLDAGGENGRTLAELGIGTNPGAKISGQILEDEKVEGTVHFAFGTNTSFGGDNQATVHIDGLVRNATVELDGRFTLRDGQLFD